MRRKSVYIYQLPNWPRFTWRMEVITPYLTQVRYRQGYLIGRMESLGFKLQEEANLKMLTLNVLKSSEIEGEMLNPDQVRSSIARRLGIEIAGLVQSDRNVDGIVEMMLDATHNYKNELTAERLFGWHSCLFPTGRSGMHKITVGSWRNNKPDDPMQVISGAIGKERIHFQAPDAEVLGEEMNTFLTWFNEDQTMDAVLKAALAHLWFVTIHPFDDGNGRIARAIADLQLCRADATLYRFYSMSSQIRKERNIYYDILEKTQQGSLDITAWIMWFLGCLERSIDTTKENLESVLAKAKFWELHAETIMNGRQKMMVNRMLDGFDGKLTSSKWAKITKISQDTALRDIHDLLEKNVLLKENAGGRSTSYTISISG